MRIVFIATASFAVPALKRLWQRGHEIPLVITRPDASGARRGNALTPPAVKVACGELKLTVLQPKMIYDVIDQVQDAAPDVIIVCAYGQLLPKTLIDIPPKGTYNIHASLLPKYRGAAPVHRAILNGENRSGVCIMKVAPGLDEGDICLCREVPITESTTVRELYETLSEIGGDLLCDSIELLERGKLTSIPQAEALMSYAQKVEKSERHVNFNRGADEVSRHIRGMDDFPGAYANLDGKRVLFYKASVYETQALDQVPTPGTILGLSKDMRLIVACEKGSVVIGEIKVEGKAKTDAKSFYNGLKAKAKTFN
jgi:methionyl-tRNA formyltransferase